MTPDMMDNMLSTKLAPLVEQSVDNSLLVREIVDQNRLRETEIAVEDQQQYSRRTAFKFHNVPVPDGDLS